MPPFIEILKLITFPIVIPARLYNGIMTKFKSMSGTAIKIDIKEQDDLLKVKVVVPRNIVNVVIEDSVVEKIQTETGVVLCFNYRILTPERKPHSITLSGTTEACERAKILCEKAILNAEMECVQRKLKTAERGLCQGKGAGDDYSVKTTMERFECIPAIFKDFVRVDVMRIESPDDFIVKIFHGAWNPLEQMLKEYAQCLESEEMKKSLLVTDPQKGDLVAVLVREENGLVVCRADVSLLLPERSLIELVLVDTSDPMLVEDSTPLYRLSRELLTFPQQTMECGMVDLLPLATEEGKEGDERWTETEKYMFAELFYREHPIYAEALEFIQTTDCEGRAILKPLIHLWDFQGDEEVDLSQQYIDWGYARRLDSNIE